MEFSVTGVRADARALAPTLQVGLRITADTDLEVQSILLRCQIRIEPERRRYDDREQAALVELFGVPSRWSETVTPFLLTHVTAPIGGFTGSTDVELPVEVSYDLEVAAGKYFNALRDGEVPLLLLFSGTVFYRASGGMSVEQIPWDREARYALPVTTWTALIDAHYPGSGWLRLHRDTIAALQQYKARHVLPTWDAAVSQLLHDASVMTPGPPDMLS